MSWDHYRSFEAIARLGSLTQAAESLQLSQSTIGRHLASLEEQAGSPLLLRERPVQLTQRGLELLEAIEPMIDAALAARSALEDSQQLRGEVSLTTVGELLRWRLTAQLPSFYARHPQLRLRLLADNQQASLAAGEADLALRLVRPQRGELVLRKMQSFGYGLFAAPQLELGAQTPWMGLAGSLSGVAEQRHVERLFAPREPRLLIEDTESLGRAVELGLGVAILPLGLAEQLEVIAIEPHQVGAQGTLEAPRRSIWMVVHRARQHLPRVRAVIDWLEEVFEDDPRES